ncbi:MAG: hypothetical protein AAB444_03550 [Patescibacteria group bacterium]
MTEQWPKVRLFSKNSHGVVVCEKFAGLGAFQARFGFGTMHGLTRHQPPLIMGDVHKVCAEFDVLEFIQRAPSQTVKRLNSLLLKFKDYSSDADEHWCRINESAPVDGVIENQPRRSETTI